MDKKILVYLSMAILMAMSASAAFLIVTPTSSEVISGSYLFNVSWNETGVGIAADNCTLTMTSATTGQTVTIITINNTKNTDSNQTNDTIDTSSSFVDANDWSITGTCRNGSGNPTTNTITIANTISSLVVDNTVPACTLASAMTNDKEYSNSYTWPITGTNAHSATIQFGSSSVLAMNAVTTGATASFNYLKTVPSVRYPTVQMILTDDRNTTSCTQLTDANVGNYKQDKVAAFSSGGVKKTGGEDNSMMYVFIIGALVYFGLVKKK